MNAAAPTMNDARAFIRTSMNHPPGAWLQEVDKRHLEAIVVSARVVCEFLRDTLIRKAHPNRRRYVEEDVRVHVMRRLEYAQGVHPRLLHRIGMIKTRDIVGKCSTVVSNNIASLYHPDSM